VARAVNLHLLKAEDFVLAFYDMIIVYKYGSYETCSSLHLSYPCACSAGFRRPSTALSGETNAARPRPSDHYREQLTLNTTEERAKIAGRVKRRGQILIFDIWARPACRELLVIGHW
jgi:hypothetical protein